MAGNSWVAFFDDGSKYLDRFGLLLFLTAGSVVILSLVDVAGRLSAAGPAIATFITTAMLSVTCRSRCGPPAWRDGGSASWTWCWESLSRRSPL